MKRTNTWSVILLITLVAVHAYGGDNYEVQEPSQLLVQVKGVVCSFCAYGTEKNLARLKFVDPQYFGGDGVLLNLKQASITLALEANKTVNSGNIARAIKKGGYVPVAVHLKLVGPVVREGDELFVQNQWNDQLFRLLDAEGKPWKGEGYLGKEVIIQGVIPHDSLEEQIRSPSQGVFVQIKQVKTAPSQ